MVFVRVMSHLDKFECYVSAPLDLEERELMKKRMRIYILAKNARVGRCREVNSKKDEGQRLRIA